MKRIVICCDGTWKRVDSTHPTNVARLAQVVLPCAPDGTEQLLLHLDGVGCGRGTGRLARTLDRVLGGAFGGGLMAHLAEAYRFLAFNYQPGDEIFLFGFSRGAYLARSLAGLIRACGIPSRDQAARIPEAIAQYRHRGRRAHPDATPKLAFRAGFAPGVATSHTELAWRGTVLPRQDWSETAELRIAYLGIWDTVGALGVPEHIRFAAVLNRRHRFHDTCLSGSVLSARHAVAIDEARRTFLPTLWDNLDTLNVERPGPGGEPLYHQLWFPGDHSSVGGGGVPNGMSDCALHWIIEGAIAVGLAVDPDRLEAIARARNCLAPIEGPGHPLALAARLLAHQRRDRAGPTRLSDLAPAAVLRWKADPSYRPRALARLAPMIDGQPLAMIGGSTPLSLPSPRPMIAAGSRAGERNESNWRAAPA